MKNDTLRQVLSIICSNFVDTLLNGIEDNKEDFPYILAVVNFINELKEKNILVEYYETFEPKIIDMVNREASNYLAR